MEEQIFVADGKVEMEKNIRITSKIVCAYVTKNYVSRYDLSKIITDVYVTITGIVSGDPPKTVAPTRPVPAVSVRRSVTPDYIISLEDGSRFKSLKGHLRVKYNMTPNEYRKRWGLPSDYPMAAPNYAAARSLLARRMKLGHVYLKGPQHPAAK
jgi:predicted transcriptional regulator